MYGASVSTGSPDPRVLSLFIGWLVRLLGLKSFFGHSCQTPTRKSCCCKLTCRSNSIHQTRNWKMIKRMHNFWDLWTVCAKELHYETVPESMLNLRRRSKSDHDKTSLLSLSCVASKLKTKSAAGCLQWKKCHQYRFFSAISRKTNIWLFFRVLRFLNFSRARKKQTFEVLMCIC